MEKETGKKVVIAVLIKRIVLFLFIMSLLTLFLYGIGTAQNFMDHTQLFLLRLSRLWGLFLIIGAFYGILLETGLAFRKGGRRIFSSLGGLGVYTLLGIWGGLLAAVSTFINAAARGNI
jgi:hypothetical protein